MTSQQLDNKLVFIYLIDKDPKSATCLTDFISIYETLFNYRQAKVEHIAVDSAFHDKGVTSTSGLQYQG